MRWIALDITWGSSQWLSVLSAECRLAWVELLCYVKASGSDGRVRSMAAARFARMIYVGEESVIQLLKAAENHGALCADDGDWVITKWRDYQYASSSTPRVQKHRETKKTTPQVQGNVSETHETLRNVSETDVTLDKDKDKDKDKPPKSPASGGPAIPASLESLRGLIEEFVSHRKHMGKAKALTPEALRRQCLRFERWGVDVARRQIEECIERGWMAPIDPSPQNSEEERKAMLARLNEEYRK